MGNESDLKRDTVNCIVLPGHVNSVCLAWCIFQIETCSSNGLCALMDPGRVGPKGRAAEPQGSQHLVFKKVINRSLNHTIAEVFLSLCDYKIEDWRLALLKPRFCCGLVLAGKKEPRSCSLDPHSCGKNPKKKAKLVGWDCLPSPPQLAPSYSLDTGHEGLLGEINPIPPGTRTGS